MEQPQFKKTKLTSRQDDYAQWYLDVAQNGDMFAYSPVPGCITFLPKAVNIWEKIKEIMNEDIKAMGVQNLYLPLLIPMSFFEKEKEHVEWFAPELAVVTVGWGKDLEDKLAIRPTSETLFCDFFRENLQSYRDLPMLYNQWVNVFRWEKRTRPFLRTAEFYWQEGHTLHEEKQDADEFAKNILHNVYAKIIREYLAIDGIAGIKTESEKFAGAERTYTFEPMMSNGWALQICTTHVLGEGFMKQFNVSYINRSWEKAYPSYTSWGMSTRSIWWVISSHSDDRWLIIPPKIAEFKAVILPIYNKWNEDTVNTYVKKIAKIITGSDAILPFKWENFKKILGNNNDLLVDFRNVKLGEKITDFELSGYPIRIECWERDIENNVCVVTSRITGEKQIVNLDNLPETIQNLIEEGQNELFKRSQQRLRENTIACDTLEQVGEAVENGKFAIYEWDWNPELEEIIKERFKATTRCLPFEGQFTDDVLQLKNPQNKKVIIARAF